MVCDACTETDASITSKEILTVLNAGATYIPHIHPLREYIHNLSDYIPEKEPDWIDLVAKQVRVVDTTQSYSTLLDPDALQRYHIWSYPLSTIRCVVGCQSYAYRC
jgi:hypothetical protein